MSAGTDRRLVLCAAKASSLHANNIGVNASMATTTTENNAIVFFLLIITPCQELKVERDQGPSAAP